MAGDKPRQLGRYQLLAKLATGGMAEIHLARQKGIAGFERLVVIKKILAHLAEEERFLEMFLDEARITVRLNHPNIVQTYDLGHEDDEYFLAMEYLEGESLGFLVREASRLEKWLPQELAAAIVAYVCEGLAYAHALKDDSGQPLHIVHRDVSPQNIIILFNGSVKLVDFGIAKAATKVHQTRVGTMKGKLAYMAPEQCAGKTLDGRADVFSLGVVLWELLARRRLYKRENEAAVLQALINEEPPSIREIQPEVAGVLEAVALRALAKDPEDRFRTCDEMAEAIRDHLRRSQAAAGRTEIAEFVDTIFADRARTKKRVLEQVEEAGGGEVSLEILKPGTGESMPSRSVVDEPPTQALAEVPTAIKRSVQTKTTMHQPRSKWQPLALGAGGLVIVFLLVGILFDWFSGTGKKPSPGNPDPVVGPDAAIDGGENGADGSGSTSATNDPLPADAGVPTNRPSMLSITSKPGGCAVTVDEVEVPGVTPIKEVAVEAGQEHKVTVLCDGHLKETKAVIAGSGQKISLEFDPKPEPPKKIAKGRLRLDTEPWSAVYLGKRRLGITPLLGVKLPAGKHKLRLVNDESKLKKTIWVTIKPGKTTTLYRKF